MIDQRLFYKGKVEEVNTIILFLKRLNADTSKYEQDFVAIENRLNACLSSIDSKKYDKRECANKKNNFYSMYGSQLDDLCKRIRQEYDSLSKYKQLEDNINNGIENVNYENISTIIENTNKLLDYLDEEDYLEYEEKVQKANYVYTIVYKVIKLELLYTNNSTLLERVKENSSSSIYITKLIKEELDEIDSNDMNALLYEKINNARREEFSTVFGSYLDRELIMLLTIEYDTDLVSKVKESFDNQMDKCNVIISEIKQEKNNTDYYIKRIKYSKKDNLLLHVKNFYRAGIIGLNIFAVSITWPFIKDMCTKDSNVETYMTYSTDYDSSDPDSFNTVTEYKKKQDKTLSITEYSEWEKPGYFRDDYQRNVYKYELKDKSLFFEDVRDYLDTNNKYGVLISSTTTEKVKELPSDEKIYDGSKYVISQSYQDYDDMVLSIDKSQYYANLAGGILLQLLINTMLSMLLSIPTFCMDTNSFRHNKKEISENKEKLLEAKKKITELNKTLKEVRERVNKKYDLLPNEIKDEKIKKKYLELNDNKDK